MDYLSEKAIKEKLNPFYHTVEVISNTDSTNTALKGRISALTEGYVLISDSQTEGRGRNGKAFYSEKGKGIYLSLVLRPNLPVNHSLVIAGCAAVAAAQAVNKICGVNSKIKWVNDIFIGDKKVAGILCESGLKAGTAQLDYMIVGIGINVHPLNMPAEISGIAGSISDFTDIEIHRNAIITEFLNLLCEYYKNMEQKTFLPAYRRLSDVIGKNIIVYENNTHYNAYAIDIDEYGGLVIDINHQRKTLYSGEISIRKADHL